MESQEGINLFSLYHLGIETGGTTCKVGIIKDGDYK
jgi:hypothetical protein